MDDEFVIAITEVQPRLFRFIYTLLPNVVDARDVLQETNLALWAHRTEFRRGAAFWPWASQFARLQVLAFLKRVKQERSRQLHLGNDQLLELLAEESASDLLDFEHHRDALEQCMKLLPKASVQILRRRYFEAQLPQTIGEQMGQSSAVIRLRLHRIRLRLMECIRRRLAQEESR